MCRTLPAHLWWCQRRRGNNACSCRQTHGKLAKGIANAAFLLGDG